MLLKSKKDVLLHSFLSTQILHLQNVKVVYIIQNIRLFTELSLAFSCTIKENVHMKRKIFNMQMRTVFLYRYLLFQEKS